MAVGFRREPAFELGQGAGVVFHVPYHYLWRSLESSKYPSAGKRLELLKETVPGVRRVSVLAPPLQRAPGFADFMRETEIAARSLGVKLQVVQVREPGEFEGAFSAMVKERTDAVIVAPDVMFYAQRARIAELAAKSRLPAMYPFREHVEAGGLMSYGASIPDLLRRSAMYVHKILKGAKPADLPVEQPTRFELVINMRTAKALGLTIPQSVLFRADKIIE